MLKPLVKKSIVEEIIANFMHMVQTDDLKQGDRIASERDLAQQWRVSRSSVREAMKILAFNKVVTIKQGNGTFLNKFPNAIIKKAIAIDSIEKRECNLLQRFEARMILEPMLIKLAAERIDKGKLDMLKKTVNNMEEFLKNGQYGGYATEDINFHSIIAKAANNKYLYEMFCSVIIDSSEWYYSFGHTPNLESWSYKEHLQMYEALEEHNAEKAESIMKQHIQSALREYRKYVGISIPESYYKDYNVFENSQEDKN